MIVFPEEAGVRGSAPAMTKSVLLAYSAKTIAGDVCVSDVFPVIGKARPCKETGLSMRIVEYRKRAARGYAAKAA